MNPSAITFSDAALVAANLLGLAGIFLLLRLLARLRDADANPFARPQGNDLVVGEFLTRIEAKLDALQDAHAALGETQQQLHKTVQNLRLAPAAHAPHHAPDPAAPLPLAPARSAAPSDDPVPSASYVDTTSYADAMEAARGGAGPEELARRCGISLAEAELVAALSRGAKALQESDATALRSRA